MKRLLSAVVALFAALCMYAVEDEYRPVTAAYTLEVGTSHLSDTYLTPLKYKGLSIGLGYERMQAMKFSPEKWVMQLSGRLGVNRAENPARNAVMWDLDLDLSWGMMRRWSIKSISGLQLYGGGATMLDVGALYLARNGNNPVSAKAAWTVGVSGMAVYNFKISRLPVCLRYQAVLPVTGAFFSPDYGELYYEIYLGNHAGLAHAAWWGNYFRLNNLLTADLRLGATNLRLGYRANILSTKVNNIVSREIIHSFVVGVSGEWLSVQRSGTISPTAKIISAMY
ncbi:MAG: DUF3316 domain-containing protein [Muribaculaceae bacterium]|nr:DUF3316 domain-containing protein [Muribaculaceae bacterium]